MVTLETLQSNERPVVSGETCIQRNRSQAACRVITGAPADALDDDFIPALRVFVRLDHVGVQFLHHLAHLLLGNLPLADYAEGLTKQDENLALPRFL